VWNVKSLISSRKKLLVYIQDGKAKMETTAFSENLVSLYKEQRHITDYLKL
jgi:hypothetical protein